MDYTALGERIRKARIKMNLTQETLASQIEVSTSFIGHIERGTRKASLETLVKLANALRTGVDALLADSLKGALCFEPIAKEEWSTILAILDVIRNKA